MKSRRTRSTGPLPSSAVITTSLPTVTLFVIAAFCMRTNAASKTPALAVAATCTSIRTEQLNDRYQDDIANRDLRRTGRLYQEASSALWGATGVLAVTSVILAIFTRWRKSERARKVVATPLILPAGGGLSVTWTP